MSPAILTVQGDEDHGLTTTYGSECPEHPEYDREGLSQQHAQNVVVKHNRESHALLEVNLTEAAKLFLEELGKVGSTGQLSNMWTALMGRNVALAELRAWATADLPVTATVAPF